MDAGSPAGAVGLSVRAALLRRPRTLRVRAHAGGVIKVTTHNRPIARIVGIPDHCDQACALWWPVVRQTVPAKSRPLRRL